MENIKIDYAALVSGIELEFNTAINELKRTEPADSPFLEQLSKISNIYVDDEQNFVRKTEIDPKAVYIVVSFGSGTMNYGASIVNCTLKALTTQNQIKPVQYLFNAFVSKWTTKSLNGLDSSGITQIWQTPSIGSNFISVGNGFRSLIAISGVFVVGYRTIRVGYLKYFVDGNPSNTSEDNVEIIDIMTYTDNFQSSLAPQPFGNTEGFGVSQVSFSSFTFGASTYLLDTKFSEKILQIRGFKKPGQTSGYLCSQNEDFAIQIYFTNGYTNIGNNLTDMHGKFKLVSSAIKQELGGLPMLSFSFSY